MLIDCIYVAKQHHEKNRVTASVITSRPACCRAPSWSRSSFMSIVPLLSESKLASSPFCLSKTRARVDKAGTHYTHAGRAPAECLTFVVEDQIWGAGVAAASCQQCTLSSRRRSSVRRAGGRLGAPRLSVLGHEVGQLHCFSI